MRRSVLVVEDEAMIAMMIEEYLDLLDFRLFAVAATVDEALEALSGESKPCLGLLDCRLGKERSWPVAMRLRELGVPFIFMTGAPDDQVPQDVAHVAMLGKPFTLAALEQALGHAMA